MDNTEETRRTMVNTINLKAMEREGLENVYGQVWDTKQLQEDFKVVGFMAPFVMVTRKKDGANGALMFQAAPRYYFDFVEG